MNIQCVSIFNGTFPYNGKEICSFERNEKEQKAELKDFIEHHEINVRASDSHTLPIC